MNRKVFNSQDMGENFDIDQDQYDYLEALKLVTIDDEDIDEDIFVDESRYNGLIEALDKFKGRKIK